MERSTDNTIIYLRKETDERLQTIVLYPCPLYVVRSWNSEIVSHLEENNILSENQHGFRKHRSCESQLAITLQDLSDGLNSGDQMDCILLDFSEAFAKVPNQRLLNTCSYYGIRGNTLLWIASFL
jgi:hypothetical protein